MRFTGKAFVLAGIVTASWGTVQCKSSESSAADLTHEKDESAPASLFDLAASKVNTEKAEFEYQAQVSRLMNLIVHSMYENQEVFIRELLANCCDAIDKRRRESFGTPEAATITQEAKVSVRIDKQAGTISFIDNGIGMNKDQLVEYLGTIAKSGTAELLAKLQESKDANNLIGQFGVGFYTAFLVADEVAVASKSKSDPKQHVWLSKADSGSFSIFEDPRGNTLSCGTEVTLKLKSTASSFLDQETVKKVMETYASFYPYPIFLEMVKTIDEEVSDAEATQEEQKPVDEEAEVENEDKGEEKAKKTVTKEVKEEIQINSSKPIWIRDAKSVSEEEYNQFYKATFKEKDEPLTYIHFKAEGDIEFRGLLYIRKKPFRFGHDDRESRSLIHLYVRRAFVTDKLDDFFPPALNFVTGIVDSDDLSLNISRESLQNNSVLRAIKSKTLSKVFDALKKQCSDKKKFKEIFDSYGDVFKQLALDEKYRSKVLPLLHFATNKSNGELVSFQEYVDRKKDDQKAIYYLAGSSAKEIEKSPYLEKLSAGGFEVFYMTGPIDEHVISTLGKFEDSEFQNAASENFRLPGESADMKSLEEEFKPLMEVIQSALKDDVEKVKLTTRLVDSPCVVVAAQHGWTGNMERIVMAQASAKDFPLMEFYAMQKKVFEINPSHSLIKSLLKAAKENPKSKALQDHVTVLYDSGLVQAGYSLKNPQRFSSLIQKMTLTALGEAPAEEPVSDSEKKSADEDAADFNDESDDRDEL